MHVSPRRRARAAASRTTNFPLLSRVSVGHGTSHVGNGSGRYLTSRGECLASGLCRAARVRALRKKKSRVLGVGVVTSRFYDYTRRYPRYPFLYTATPDLVPCICVCRPGQNKSTQKPLTSLSTPSNPHQHRENPTAKRGDKTSGGITSLIKNSFPKSF